MIDKQIVSKSLIITCFLGAGAMLRQRREAPVSSMHREQVARPAIKDIRAREPLVRTTKPVRPVLQQVGQPARPISRPLPVAIQSPERRVMRAPAQSPRSMRNDASSKEISSLRSQLKTLQIKLNRETANTRAYEAKIEELKGTVASQAVKLRELNKRVRDANRRAIAAQSSSENVFSRARAAENRPDSRTQNQRVIASYIAGVQSAAGEGPYGLDQEIYSSLMPILSSTDVRQAGHAGYISPIMKRIIDEEVVRRVGLIIKLINDQLDRRRYCTKEELASRISQDLSRVSTVLGNTLPQTEAIQAKSETALKTALRQSGLIFDKAIEQLAEKLEDEVIAIQDNISELRTPLYPAPKTVAGASYGPNSSDIAQCATDPSISSIHHSDLSICAAADHAQADGADVVLLDQVRCPSQQPVVHTATLPGSADIDASPQPRYLSRVPIELAQPLRDRSAATGPITVTRGDTLWSCPRFDWPVGTIGQHQDDPGATITSVTIYCDARERPSCAPTARSPYSPGAPERTTRIHSQYFGRDRASLSLSTTIHATGLDSKPHDPSFFYR